jgi:RNA polymerase sigma-70 factor (ECF subfamily)
VDVHSEHQWILRAQAGDRDAFAALVERYWSSVYRWLARAGRGTHAAEDLTQEVFLKAWGGLRSFRSGTNFRAWLFRIARNCLVDLKRGRSPQPFDGPTDALASPAASPPRVMLDREGRQLLERAVGQLPDEYRVAFLLRAEGGLSFREIATALGLTEETARWRVFKARQLLLDRLGPYLDGSP